MHTIWLKGFVLVSLLVSCQGQEATHGISSNSVVLLIKDELKNEIISTEMAEVIAKNNEQQKSNCTCNCNKSPIQDYNFTELSNMVEDKLEILLLLGWMQVAKLDMINSSHQCPPNTTLRIIMSI